MEKFTKKKKKSVSNKHQAYKVKRMKNKVEVSPATSLEYTREYKLGVMSAVFLSIVIYFLIQGQKKLIQKTDESKVKPNLKASIDEGINGEERIQRTYKDFSVIDSIPHDPKSFTQGLFYHDGYIYEGTGLNGQSNIFKIDPKSGEVLKQLSKPLSQELFGEGIAYFDGKILQLTWKNKMGFVYNSTTLEMMPDDSMPFPSKFQFSTTTGEGWGVTYDSDRNEFIVSDGSHILHFWDADTLQEKRRKKVYWKIGADKRYVKLLNELEYLNGMVLANIWYEDVIASINPETGEIEQVLDFRELWPISQRTNLTHKVDCFNGISSTDVDGELFVTGKWWPKIYRVKLHSFRFSLI